MCNMGQLISERIWLGAGQGRGAGCWRRTMRIKIKSLGKKKPLTKETRKMGAVSL